VLSNHNVPTTVQPAIAVKTACTAKEPTSPAPTNLTPEHRLRDLRFAFRKTAFTKDAADRLRAAFTISTLSKIAARAGTG